MSTILGAISASSIAIAIYLAYLNHGAAKAGYGMTGLLAVLFSLIGVILGMKALQGRDTYRFFAILGTILNLLVLVALGFVVYLGEIL